MTPTALQALNLGYLSGADLSQWCNMQILIAELNQRPSILTKAVAQAIAEVKSKLFNVYDLTQELSLSDVVLPQASPTLAAKVITAIAVTSPGTGIIGVPSISITDQGGGTGATATAVISDTTVQSVEILSQGRHFTQAPAVVFSGGNPTRPASGYATLGAIQSYGRYGFPDYRRTGSVVSITITDSGAGYKSTPTISFTGGGGLGANAVALMQYGQLTGITVTSGGTNYVNPVIQFTGNFQISDQREQKLVKVIGIYAIRNVFGNMQNVSKSMQDYFADADQMLLDIISGLGNLDLYGAKPQIRSSLQLGYDKFRQIG